MFFRHGFRAALRAGLLRDRNRRPAVDFDPAPGRRHRDPAVLHHGRRIESRARQDFDTIQSARPLAFLSFGFLALLFVSILTSKDPTQALNGFVDSVLTWYVPLFACIFVVRTEKDDPPAAEDRCGRGNCRRGARRHRIRAGTPVLLRPVSAGHAGRACWRRIRRSSRCTRSARSGTASIGRRRFIRCRCPSASSQPWLRRSALISSSMARRRDGACSE